MPRTAILLTMTVGLSLCQFAAGQVASPYSTGINFAAPPSTTPSFDKPGLQRSPNGTLIQVEIPMYRPPVTILPVPTPTPFPVPDPQPVVEPVPTPLPYPTPVPKPQPTQDFIPESQSLYPVDVLPGKAITY
jgi:hypothetical protein